MVKFMDQFDRAKGCPDNWSNVIFGVSVKVCVKIFLKKITAEICRLKKDHLTNACRYLPVFEGLNRTKETVNLFFLLKLEHSSSPPFGY
jgi:hypothetical protein